MTPQAKDRPLFKLATFDVGCVVTVTVAGLDDSVH
jgi:hypothetical protein